MIELTLPKPMQFQRPILDDPARYKVVRAGRRFSKSVLAMIAALAGHGPRVTHDLIQSGDFPHATLDRLGLPLWPGVAEDWIVLWIAPDYTQTDALWFEEIHPRWGDHPDIILRESSPRVVQVRGYKGRLQLATMENIRSIRGRGARVIGVIVEEAAWLDLEYAWRHVLRPLLMDNQGWAIFISTTNSGDDGNKTKRVPSYFNLLCEQIQGGERSWRWKHFHGTARDNPRIAPAEFAELLEEFPEGTVEREQEIEANLLQPQGGLAFPEWDHGVHVKALQPDSSDWRWISSGDWGRTAPGWLGLTACGPGGQHLVRYEWYFNGRITEKKYTPYEAGFEWGQQIKRFPKPEWHSMDCPAVSDGGPTILEQFQAGLDAATGQNERIPCVKPPKGPGYRATSKQMMHQLLSFKKSEAGVLIRPPRLIVHPECANLIRTVPKLPRDPKKMEEIWNDPSVEDHPFDGLMSGIMSRTPQVEREEVGRDPNKHPGVAKKHRRYMKSRGNLAPIGGGEPRYLRYQPGAGDSDEWDDDVLFDPDE